MVILHWKCVPGSDLNNKPRPAAYIYPWSGLSLGKATRKDLLSIFYTEWRQRIFRWTIIKELMIICSLPWLERKGLHRALLERTGTKYLKIIKSEDGFSCSRLPSNVVFTALILLSLNSAAPFLLEAKIYFWHPTPTLTRETGMTPEWVRSLSVWPLPGLFALYASVLIQFNKCLLGV